MSRVYAAGRGAPGYVGPGSARAREHLAGARSDAALVLSSLGRHAEAERWARTAVRESPRDSLAWNNLGVVLYQAGDAVAAVAAFERALSISAGFARARENLAAARRGARPR